MGLKRIAFEGVYSEEDDSGGVRYYCRSPIDGIRASVYLDEQQEVADVYSGVADDDEYDEDQQELMLKVLADPAVQEIMAILGGTLVSVTPDTGPR